MTRVEKIGNATLYLGDCREVLPTLSRVDAVVADPPYGIPHDFGTQQHYSNKGLRALQFEWDGEHVNEAVFEAARLCMPLANAQFWFCGLHQLSFIGNTMLAAGLTPKPAAWVKKVPAPAMKGNWWPSGFEMAVYAYRSGAGVWFGDRDAKRCNVFYSDSYRHGQPGKENHPTQKPLGLITRIVTSLVPPDGVVLDPFMGSGTTGAAALMTGRRFVGVELNEDYFAIACRRAEDAQRQTTLFDAEPSARPQQVGLEL